MKTIYGVCSIYSISIYNDLNEVVKYVKRSVKKQMLHQTDDIAKKNPEI